jgi:hypothetical protein
MENQRIDKIAQGFIATKQSSSSCCALFHFLFFSDFIAAGCEKHFFFSRTFELYSFFFLHFYKNLLAFVGSLMSLMLLVTQKKNYCARSTGELVSFFVVKSHDFVNVNKNVQKKETFFCLLTRIQRKKSLFHSFIPIRMRLNICYYQKL